MRRRRTEFWIWVEELASSETGGSPAALKAIETWTVMSALGSLSAVGSGVAEIAPFE